MRSLSAILRASSKDTLGNSSANSSPPIRAQWSVAADSFHVPGERRQHAVADRMAVAVIDLFEAVDVHDQHMQLRAEPLDAAQLNGHARLQPASVQQAGEGIVVGQHLQPGVGAPQPLFDGAALQCKAHRAQQVRRYTVFAHVVLGAFADHDNATVFMAALGNDDNCWTVGQGVQAGQQRLAVAVGQAAVEQHAVKLVVAQQVVGAFEGGRLENLC